MKKLRFRTIRGRALLYFSLILIPVLASSLFTFVNARRILMNAVTLFETNVFNQELLAAIDDVDSPLEAYLIHSDSDSLREYYNAGMRLMQLSGRLNAPSGREQANLIRRTMHRLILRFLRLADEAVSAKRGRFTGEYIGFYSDTSRVSEYITSSAERLNRMEFQANTDLYLSFSSSFSKVELSSLALVLSMGLLALILVSWSSFNLSNPIARLADAAEEIAKRKFDSDDIPVRGDDEITRLTRTYNSMKTSIHEYIGRIRENAEIESRLMEEKVKNLDMTNLLKTAELQALQSQIDPHFLFNTLNTGIQLAIVEGADRTSEYLERLCDVYRRNVRPLAREATLDEELETLQSYIYVLRIRFGDRYRFEIEATDESRSIRLPSMILQPLVENAIQHGLAATDTGGVVRITAGMSDGRCLITVADNGKGMDKSRIEEILRSDMFEHLTQEKGIGLRNVLLRLNLYFGEQIGASIESAPGQGTTIRLSLPATGRKEDA